MQTTWVLIRHSKWHRSWIGEHKSEIEWIVTGYYIEKVGVTNLEIEISEVSKYSTGLCQDLIEIDRDRINGQLITRHSDLRKVCAWKQQAGHEYNCIHK